MEVLRSMKPNEWDAVAELIFISTNTWYEQNGKAPVFSCSPSDLKFFCEVYEGMDPGCCIIAEVDGKIAASCFYHPRPTHYSLGIMCVHPDFYGRGLAKKLLNEIINMAKVAEKPLNLISSAVNLDSFSLYNKAGFIPKGFYQDMVITVPEEGFSFTGKQFSEVRKAKFSDIPKMVQLEKEIHDQDHGKDLQFIINDSSGCWNCHILEEDGSIQGFLCSIKHASANIIGLGAVRDSASSSVLIKSHLDYFKGRCPLMIIPAREKALVQDLLKMKARNVELHITQTISETSVSSPNGIILPTFMPE